MRNDFVPVLGTFSIVPIIGTYAEIYFVKCLPKTGRLAQRVKRIEGLEYA